MPVKLVLQLGTWGLWMVGYPNPMLNLKKTAVSHVTVTNKEMALSPVDNEKQSCCMSLTIFSPLSHPKFEK